MNTKSEQEIFWEGGFGTEYSSRVNDDKITSSYIAMHSAILKSTIGVKSVIEFGANIGLNLIAINQLLPSLELSAIEINEFACNSLKKLDFIHKVYNKSIFDISIDYKRDLVLIKTVLIHLNPELLENAYNLLYKFSSKYICIIEYYSPAPIEVNYRGHSNKLFKRDFAGEMLDKFTDLELVDYGFIYHRDNNFPIGDVNWFLLQKK